MLLRLALSATLIGLLLWQIDIGEGLRTIRHARFAYIGLALPLFSLSKLLVAYRWRLMLRRDYLPVSGLYGIFMATNGANSFFPFWVAEVARVQLMASRYGISRASGAAVVFVAESLLDGVAFLALFLVALAFLDVSLLPRTLIWALATLIIGGLIAGNFVARIRLREGWEERGFFAKLPGRMKRSAANSLPDFVEGLSVLRDARLATLAQFLTIGAWLMEATAFYLFGLTFGLGLSFPDFIVVMLAPNIIGGIPLLPSLGPYEVSVTGVLVLLGVNTSEAGAYALGTHVITILWTTVTGLLAMWVMRISFSDLFYFGLKKAARGATNVKAADLEQPVR